MIRVDVRRMGEVVQTKWVSEEKDTHRLIGQLHFTEKEWNEMSYLLYCSLAEGKFVINNLGYNPGETKP